jgi:uncharacterized glyoxalase superfamily protein PhnB
MSTVTSSVEVAADPATAFSIFTEEVGCWWAQGPINFYDSARAYGKRIEPGVGGRVIEVYDDATGEGLELARITVWEPGERLSWRSSLDDVEIDVSFVPSATDGRRTVVRVEATIPTDGADRGGTAWVRMTPSWFGGWVGRRDHVPHEPEHLARLAVGVHYAKPVTAARWLHEVFGLEPTSELPANDADFSWIDLRVGNARLIVFARDGVLGESSPVTHTPWVFVDDLDAHFARAKAGGATVIRDIWQHGYRAYEAADLEGNRWTFAQASPNMR